MFTLMIVQMIEMVLMGVTVSLSMVIMVVIMFETMCVLTGILLSWFLDFDLVSGVPASASIAHSNYFYLSR